MNDYRRTVTTDGVLQLLAHRRRREVLRYLMENGDSAVTTDELVEGITGDGQRQTESGSPAGGNAASKLHHVHLPKLVSAGLVEYDSRSATIRYQPHDAIEQLLEAIRETLG